MKKVIIFLIGLMIGVLFAEEIRPVIDTIVHKCSKIVAQLKLDHHSTK